MNKKTNLLLLLKLIFVFSLSILLGCSPSTPTPMSETQAIPKLASADPPQPFANPQIQLLDDLLQQTASQRTDILAFVIYQVRIDHVDFSRDGSLALVWIKWIDPETTAFIPGELSLCIGRQEKDSNSGKQVWKLYFQTDSDWEKMLKSVPTAMLGPELRARYMPQEQSEQKTAKVFTGYKLPWEAGRSKYLTGSIGHVFTYKTCPADCLYAFDFADGTEFPVLAAGNGKVKAAVWQYPDNLMEHANYLLLQDDSTTPTTFQLYYHLAQDSIPANFRVPGTEVLQGQYIGNADNTGPSTGHHLHFMVYTSPKGFWGTSVDIVFSDVSENGGRPRTCTEANNYPNFGSQCMLKGLYTSKNADMERPTGYITKPITNSIITTRKVSVSGFGEDDTAVKSIQLMYTYDGTWQPVLSAPVKGSKFTNSIDTCLLKIPDGDFFLSVQVTDKSGKVSEGQSGMIHLTKNYVCDPTPTPTKTLKPSKTPTLTKTLAPTKTAAPSKTPLPGKTPASAKTSAAEQIKPTIPPSSVPPTKTPRQSKPDTPALNSPVTFINGEITDQQNLTLTWSGAGEKVKYKASLKGPGDGSLIADWQSETAWTVGKIPAGKYTWTVIARNSAGSSQSSMQFDVSFSDPPPTSQLDPLPAAQKSSAILLKWKVISGLVDLNGFEIQYRDNGGKWTGIKKEFSPSDRQTWFVGQLGHSYEFRIHSLDKHGSVEPYPEKAQAYTTIEKSCTPDNFDSKKADNSPMSAIKIAVGQTQQHKFCPVSDQDWLQLSAQAGKTYNIKTWPVTGAASAFIDILSGDGKDVQSKASPAAPDSTTLLNWKAPESKIYFIRIRPFNDHIAGTNTNYKVSVTSENLVNLPWYYYALFMVMTTLGVGGYKAAKAFKAKRAIPSTRYAADIRGIPRSIMEDTSPLPQKKRHHKNYKEILTSGMNWANRIIGSFHGEPGQRKVVMARKPRRF